MTQKTLFNSFDKQLLQTLPRIVFEGRIIVVQSENEANRAVDFLMRQPILGFDTETRPTFRPGPMNQVALLQVSTHDTCFLFRLNMIGLPDSVLRLLTDTEVTKVGLSLQDDFNQLSRRRRFRPGTFIDIQSMVRSMGIEDQSLQRIYANVFGQKISKGQQLSNWEAGTLTEPQKRYAATDAWACIQLYEELTRLQETGFTLEVVNKEK